MFCPKCKAMLVLNRRTGQRECKRPNCNYSESKGKKLKSQVEAMEKKEIVVTEGIEGTLPTTKIICRKMRT